MSSKALPIVRYNKSMKHDDCPGRDYLKSLHLSPPQLSVLAGVTKGQVAHWLGTGQHHRCPDQRSLRLIQLELQHLSMTKGQLSPKHSTLIFPADFLQ